jgi:hypothetical protein
MRGWDYSLQLNIKPAEPEIFLRDPKKSAKNFRFFKESDLGPSFLDSVENDRAARG